MSTPAGLFFGFFLIRVIKTIGIANFISTTIAPTNHCKCRKSGGGNGMEKTEGGDITAKPKDAGQSEGRR